MVLISVLCPHCHSDHVIKGGTTKAGTQRYKCQNADALIGFRGLMRPRCPRSVTHFQGY